MMQLDMDAHLHGSGWLVAWMAMWKLLISGGGVFQILILMWQQHKVKTLKIRL